MTAARAELCRGHFRHFLRDSFAALDEASPLEWSWYLGAVCEHAEALVSGQLRELVVTQPPGTLKSKTWCVALPAWVWTDHPQSKFLLGTNEQRNLMRDSNDTRKLIRSDWYHASFRPEWRVSAEQDQKLYFETTRGGHRLGVTTGGSTGGKKGHFLLVDDIHDAAKVYSKATRDSEKAWFRNGFSDRMVNFRTGVTAVIGHRVHKEDLSGELIQEGWHHLDLPEEWSESRRKTWPVRVDDEPGYPALRSDPRTGEGEFLRPTRFGPAEKATTLLRGGALAYAAKHQQKPEVRSGLMFDYDRPRRVPSWPVGTVAVRYWDTAASETESACNSSGVLMGKTPEGRFIVVNERRFKLNASDRNRIMRNTGLEDMRTPGLTFLRLYWEKGTSDSGVERDQLLARALAGIPCAADPAKGSKVVRAEAFSSQWAAGNVDIVVNDEWDWHGYLMRMAEFPISSDKDTTDASSGAFNRLALGALDASMYGTATAAQTIMGNLPAGTYDTKPPSDPYA